MASYAYVVGVNNYVKDREGLKTLGGPYDDTIDFMKWLNEENGPAIPEANIFHISDKERCYPTKENANAKLVDMITAIDNGELHDKFYFYFAGHGVADPYDIDQNILCLSDWTKRWSNNAFSSVPAISLGTWAFSKNLYLFSIVAEHDMTEHGSMNLLPRMLV